MNLNELKRLAVKPKSTAIEWYTFRNGYLYYQYLRNGSIYRARGTRRAWNVLTHGKPSVGRVIDWVKHTADVQRWNGRDWEQCL